MTEHQTVSPSSHFLAPSLFLRPVPDLSHPPPPPTPPPCHPSLPQLTPLPTLAFCPAPKVTGLHTLDAHLQAQLLLAAISITLHLLAPNGTFIAKIFRTHQDPRAEFLVSQMRTFFPEDPSGEDGEGERGVWIRKPRSSREGSGGMSTSPLSCLSSLIEIVDSQWIGAWCGARDTEAFIVCKGFKPPPSLQAYLSHLPKEGEEANASLMQAFTDPSFLAPVAGSTEPGPAEVEGGKERRQILGWVGGGDLRSVVRLA